MVVVEWVIMKSYRLSELGGAELRSLIARPRIDFSSVFSVVCPLSVPSRVPSFSPSFSVSHTSLCRSTPFLTMFDKEAMMLSESEFVLHSSLLFSFLFLTVVTIIINLTILSVFLQIHFEIRQSSIG